MSEGDAKKLIEKVVKNLLVEVPALKQLKLVFAVELRAKGDVQLYRVQLPDIDVKKDSAMDARIRLEIMRANFNTLAADGGLDEWYEAFSTGVVRASGGQDIIKLITNVVVRKQSRGGGRRMKL